MCVENMHFCRSYSWNFLVPCMWLAFDCSPLVLCIAFFRCS